MTDQQAGGVLCPRCGEHFVRLEPRGAFISFCRKQIAFLLPREFTPEDLARLRTQDSGRMNP